MNRRNFLTLAGASAGSFLIPSTIARRIRDVCLGNSKPLILAPSCHSFDLYAQKDYSGYLLHLGDPNEPPDYPLLRDFIWDRGFNPEKTASLRDYLVNWRCHDVDSDVPIKQAIAELKDSLDEPIDGYERSYWMDWDFETSDGTLPRAFHYLADLPLDDGSSGDGFDLGSLSFVEGDRPGSNLTYVEAESLAVVASLQHRLNALDTGARIVMC
jgi:hypothetical protein